MNPDLWLPGVRRLDCSAYGLALGKGNNDEAYHTWHSFEGIPKDYNFSALRGAEYLARTLKLAHFVFNPVLGGLVQLLPANVAARTLAATTDPRYDVNRRGRRHMQTEVIANAARPFTLDMTRAGLDDLTRLMNFLRAHGVEDQWAWPGQPPPVYPGPGVPRRMPTRSGHAYHAGWPVPPGVTPHGDPGAIAAPWTLTGGTVAPAAPEWPTGWIREIQQLLNAVTGSTLDTDDSPGPLTTAAVTDYQTARGLDPDGKPGTLTRTALEADMATIDDIHREVTTVTLSAADYRDITGQEVDGPQTVTQDYVDRLTMRRVYNTLRHARAIETTLAAQGKVLEQLAAGQGIDPTQVRAAVDDAVRGSLDDLTADVRDALLTEGVADTVAARVVATIAARLNQE